MKIFGIFRGFPGLGRVVVGAGLLSMLKARGHEVKAYSYLQGNAVLVGILGGGSKMTSRNFVQSTI